VLVEEALPVSQLVAEALGDPVPVQSASPSSASSDPPRAIAAVRWPSSASSAFSCSRKGRPPSVGGAAVTLPGLLQGSLERRLDHLGAEEIPLEGLQDGGVRRKHGQGAAIAAGAPAARGIVERPAWPEVVERTYIAPPQIPQAISRERR
jgi:hypothetical protein